MDPAELELILADRPALARLQSIPWGVILREKAVWAIVLAHVCNNWGFYILLLWLPTYLNRALKVPVERVGEYALIPWVATFVVGNLAGWLSDGCWHGEWRSRRSESWSKRQDSSSARFR